MKRYIIQTRSLRFIGESQHVTTLDGLIDQHCAWPRGWPRPHNRPFS